MKYAMLVYQGGIANVFEVDRFAITPAHRNARRLTQGDFRSCENFSLGLAAAGALVVTAACNMVGDIADREWSFELDKQPFSDNFHPVDNLPNILIEEAIQLIEKFPKYVANDDDQNNVIETAIRVEDRIRKHLASLEVSQIMDDWQALRSDSIVLWPDNSDQPRTKGDLVDLCKGDEAVALGLFSCCESGVCPETVIDEDSAMPEGDQCFRVCHQTAVPQPG